MVFNFLLITLVFKKASGFWAFGVFGLGLLSMCERPDLFIRVKGPGNSGDQAQLLILPRDFPNFPGRSVNKNLPVPKGGKNVRAAEPQ